MNPSLLVMPARIISRVMKLKFASLALQIETIQISHLTIQILVAMQCQQRKIWTILFLGDIQICYLLWKRYEES